MQPRPRVVFRVASGPRRGFGHVIRAFRLADALKADAWISVRGAVPAYRVSSRVRLASDHLAVLDDVAPALLVLDTPICSDSERWMRAARRRSIPVASVHDRGVAPVASDLAVDGSVAAHRPIPGAHRTLRGPRYMVLDPNVRALRRAALDASCPRVLIALGGGPRLGLAVAIARGIVRMHPAARVMIAGGFSEGVNECTGPDDGRVVILGPQAGLAPLLAESHVAVVGGGVTLYEAAALGVPSVAIPVVVAQAPTVTAFARLGAVDAPTRTPRHAIPDAVAAAVCGLLTSPRRAARLGRRARAIVDGRGLERVATHLSRLARGGRR